MTHDPTSRILHKIVSLGKTKKFFGIKESEAIRLDRSLAPTEAKSSIQTLLAEGKIKNREGLLFPADWRPSYSSMEQRIIAFLEPCFKDILTINPKKVLKQFPLYNEQSLEKLFIKLLFEERILKLDTLLFISGERYETLETLCRTLHSFSIKEFSEQSRLKREKSFAVLSFIKKRNLLTFGNSVWIFIPPDTGDTPAATVPAES